MIVLWLSELITDYGLGNGASLLIYTNIISSLPNIASKIISENSENFSFSSIFGILILILLSFLFFTPIYFFKCYLLVLWTFTQGQGGPRNGRQFQI